MGGFWLRDRGALFDWQVGPIFRGKLGELFNEPRGCICQNTLATIARWWQLKYFLFSPPKIGEDEPILTNIFQVGWNHQPDRCWEFLSPLSTKQPTCAGVRCDLTNVAHESDLNDLHQKVHRGNGFGEGVDTWTGGLRVRFSLPLLLSIHERFWMTIFRGFRWGWKVLRTDQIFGMKELPSS